MFLNLVAFRQHPIIFHSREIGAKYHSAKHKQAGVLACGHLILWGRKALRPVINRTTVIQGCKLQCTLAHYHQSNQKYQAWHNKDAYLY